MTGKVITVLSTKGGVGKSTLARFISIVGHEQGKKVCIIDTCQNSSIATGFLKNRDSFEKNAYDWLVGEAKPSEVIQQYKDTSIYYIPSDERIDDYEDWVSRKVPKPKQLEVLKQKIEPLRQIFDYILIDTHPSENADMVNYSIAASDYCVIPLEIDLDAKLAAKRCVEIISDYQEAGYHIDYGLVWNKVEITKGKARAQLDQMKSELVEYGIMESKFIGDIRYSTTVSTSKNEGIMLNTLDNKYTKNVMNDIRSVSNTIFTKIGEAG
ncbi:ParA family protein [Paenibacillus sp. GD4]|uniref:ParA family protein n=1 Tax=Paenibacillus TaxID=44249 RepID=UPI002543950F|nr:MULTISPECIES: ParA family protein [Paenibacillus]MDQ1914411.1 ParA family protein [Paenibacillus sp. GD4]